MTTATTERPTIQTPAVILAMVLTLAFIMVTGNLAGDKKVALLVIGFGLGVSLYHAAFGFTAAYRRAFQERDLSGIIAQGVMLVLAMMLFAPLLSNGATGSVAPIGVSMVLGAFIFGIGMQLAGACGSGTLFTVGGGSPRMVVALIFFTIGGFWGSLDLAWWRTFPEMGGISLGQELGYGPAVALQTFVIIAICYGLYKSGFTIKRPLWWNGTFSYENLLRGPWPLLLSAILLALFNWATLLVAGHPWSITWAYALWGAKIATSFGWDATTSGFWATGFQANALKNSVFLDTTSVMNFAIIIGAFTAAALAGKMALNFKLPWRSWLAAVIGGLLLGYGSRLAYGCNIGAFFSGIASTSVQGWVWIIVALLGNAVGVRLRPWFQL